MTKKKNIIVVGGGGHAKSVISVIKKIKDFGCVGYVDKVDRGEILGVPWVGDDGKLVEIRKNYQCKCAAIGVGSIDVSLRRQEIKAHLDAAKFQLPVIISPTAIVNESVRLMPGVVVLDGVIINAGSYIGECSILNTGSIVDHDCSIGRFVHVAPGVVLSGKVDVGDNSMLGTGAKVIQGRRIKENSLIGAGAVVVKDCVEPGTYCGVPARKK